MKKEHIDTNSLAHTKWNCKYHIVFAPKYRRKVFYEERWLEIREILRQLCQWKGVEIIDTSSLAHTKWNCKYHVVFAPKYRRKVFFEEKRLEIREILRQLCQWKGVEIIEGEVCPDHIHMLVSIPPKMSVSGFMGYLEGKSTLLIFQKWGNMKFAYRNREFWCKGYYVDTVGKNTKAIKTYIAEQLKRDQESDQLSLFDPRDPFMGK